VKIDLYTQAGAKNGTVDVSDGLFKAPINDEAVRFALLRQLANARRPIADTKTRAEVRGGGRKPWKQKHTGRARFGSTRNPIWRKGGVAFGPTSARNFSLRITKKASRVALFSILSQKAAESQVFALESFELKQPKTKEFTKMMAKLPVKRSLLIILDEKNPNFEKSAGNVPNVKTILVNYLNPRDLLKYEKVMFMKPALKKAEELFLK
jgi:large subunit ribosomal protein L4